MTTRQHKTPRQRAEEALAVEQRRVERLTAKVENLRTELALLEEDLNDATTRRDYLAQHPDLNPASATSNTVHTTKENHA